MFRRLIFMKFGADPNKNRDLYIWFHKGTVGAKRSLMVYLYMMICLDAFHSLPGRQCTWWGTVYLSLPLTSVAVVPFANWIAAVFVRLFTSWSMKLWSVRPAPHVEGVWPHSSITSVSCSLPEMERKKRNRITPDTGEEKMGWIHTGCAILFYINTLLD